MIKDVILILAGGVLGVLSMVFVDEVGEYAEDVNPWNKHDVGNDFEEVE